LRQKKVFACGGVVDVLGNLGDEMPRQIGVDAAYHYSGDDRACFEFKAAPGFAGVGKRPLPGLRPGAGEKGLFIAVGRGVIAVRAGRLVGLRRLVNVAVGVHAAAAGGAASTADQEAGTIGLLFPFKPAATNLIGFTTFGFLFRVGFGRADYWILYERSSPFLRTFFLNYS
jgi:hypothetical protein